MNYLILVRHGQSRWNLENRFTGWVDVPLSEKGIKEAMDCAVELENVEIDVAFTSKLIRAQETLFLILAKQKKSGIFLHESTKRKEWSLHPVRFEDNEIPVFSSDALNERFYGDLQGQNKQEARETFGEEQVFIWRRSYDIRPPGGESLKDTYERTIPYFIEAIIPQLENGKNVIVSAHGNSLRSVIKYIENISDEDIPKLELETGKPVFYSFNNGKFVKDK
ncbi:2,3-bisphosphoglycerate-dependent phosphoglycerate mutase [Methanolobus sediminis]|uniref:2,3-bisphosphoglycerate-dependent phosphoglycerate mutase n=1 Tax=Methanolobus sediminis TaxID=3072978 RepID=A0AA51UKI5_9EURY|nr:2,3-bisphosphoglycerate-dependent phosphoglycerate mutase [Methanolobus sediminis]WMW24962.1 2,3-bisphosphoglycerate-dependent phosphoglycerate mutase [Methanolobus sediminis]